MSKFLSMNLKKPCAFVRAKRVKTHYNRTPYTGGKIQTTKKAVQTASFFYQNTPKLYAIGVSTFDPKSPAIGSSFSISIIPLCCTAKFAINSAFE